MSEEHEMNSMMKILGVLSLITLLSIIFLFAKPSTKANENAVQEYILNSVDIKNFNKDNLFEINGYLIRYFPSSGEEHTPILWAWPITPRVGKVYFYKDANNFKRITDPKKVIKNPKKMTLREVQDLVLKSQDINVEPIKKG